MTKDKPMKKFFSKPANVLVFGSLLVLLIWGAWMYWNNSERRQQFQNQMLASI